MSNEINIQIESIEVKSEVKSLRHGWKVCESNKEWYGRLPRKKKKQLKKRMGEEGFIRWWNGLDVYYHPGVEKELRDIIEQR
jgi:bisphosphoglycerate-dependent phosphoglycerate mutase